ncbi:MAG: hypothetical protein AAGA83_01580 [Cyanobacteria bacterium P01_F01_bin.116]
MQRCSQCRLASVSKSQAQRTHVFEMPNLKDAAEWLPESLSRFIWELY